MNENTSNSLAEDKVSILYILNKLNRDITESDVYMSVCGLLYAILFSGGTKLNYIDLEPFCRMSSLQLFYCVRLQYQRI